MEHEGTIVISTDEVEDNVEGSHLELGLVGHLLHTQNIGHVATSHPRCTQCSNKCSETVFSQGSYKMQWNPPVTNSFLQRTEESKRLP